MNTTAVELGLGTGGWHVVHWNLDARREWHAPAPGLTVMKLRYTSLQVDVAAPRSRPSLADLDRRDAGRGRRAAQPARGDRGRVQARPVPTVALVYVMTDGGALPIAISDLVVAAARPRS